MPHPILPRLARWVGPSAVAFLLFAAASVRASTLNDLVASYSALRIGESSAVAVENLRIVSGHLELTLLKGRAAPVLAGNGDTIGLFFDGEGRFDYTVVDPVEFPILRFNLKNCTHLTPTPAEGALRVGGTLKTLFFIAGPRDRPALTGAPAGSLSESFRSHEETFSREYGQPLSHLLTLQRLMAPDTPLARAEIGGDEPLVHLLDPVVNRSESFYELHPSGNEDKEVRRQLYGATLSDLPTGRDRRQPPMPRFLLVDVDYALVASNDRDASLTVTETVVPVERPLGVLRFDLDGTVYDVASTGALEARHLRVRSVTDSAGRALAYDHRGDELIVELPEPVPARTPAILKFEIEGDFLIRPHGDNFWQLGTSSWFPQPDLGEQAYTIHSVVKVPKPFVAFAPGRTIARRTEGDLNVVENRIEQPVQFAVVHAGKYEMTEETRGGVTVRVASYAGRNERAWKQLTDLAFGIMEYYQNFLGPFPFPEFNIIEVHEFGYGQAPPATMFITQEAFQSRIGEANQFFSRGVNERFAHEIAHQYWGHVVKMPSYEEQWLTESFAEYCAALFLRKYEGKGTFDSLIAHWKAGAKEAGDAAPIPLANRIRVPANPLRASVLRFDLLYDKGPWLLSRIHAQTDDKTFLTFLKSYQTNFRWKFGSTKHVAGVLKAVTGKDWGPFFEANYWGTGMAE